MLDSCVDLLWFCWYLIMEHWLILGEPTHMLVHPFHIILIPTNTHCKSHAIGYYHIQATVWHSQICWSPSIMLLCYLLWILMGYLLWFLALKLMLITWFASWLVFWSLILLMNNEFETFQKLMPEDQYYSNNDRSDIVTWTCLIHASWKISDHWQRTCLVLPTCMSEEMHAWNNGTLWRSYIAIFNCLRWHYVLRVEENLIRCLNFYREKLAESKWYLQYFTKWQWSSFCSLLTSFSYAMYILGYYRKLCMQYSMVILGRCRVFWLPNFGVTLPDH